MRCDMQRSPEVKAVDGDWPPRGHVGLMPTLEQLLRDREGVRTKVYLDSRGKPTVGIGHLVTPADKLKVGDEITDQQVSEFFKKDSAEAVSAAKSQAAKAGISDSNFLVYLASVNFQLGTSWYKVH